MTSSTETPAVLGPVERMVRPGAEARPICVFKLDDNEWWAGESLEACVVEGQRQCGDDCFRPDEFDQYELSDGAMHSLMFIDEDGSKRTFAAELARRIAAGEQFPQQFAAEDW